MAYYFNEENGAEFGRLGGLKSGENRRKKAELKNIAKELMKMGLKSGVLEDFDCIEEARGKNLTGAEAIFINQMLKALKGDTKSAEFCFHYADMEPSQNIDIKADVNETNDEVANILNILTDFKENQPKYSGKNKDKK